ncbi:MAG: helix-turn-helix transcriptional regulator [Tannerellaceae bacterium]|nr:helix-turn-helix transcriptional regulator [Tannerellaceae bacterium]
MDIQCTKEKYIFQGQEYLCSLELAMTIIGGKWKPMIIFHLKDGPLRSGELQRTLPQISNKMFTQSIRELERSGMIERIVYAVIPPKVEYQLTPAGQSLLPIVLELARWGIEISQPKEVVE